MQEHEEASTGQDEIANRMEGCNKVEEDSDSEQTSRGLEGDSSRGMEQKSSKRARKGKKRGPNRQNLALGGIKKQEKATRILGWLGFQPRGRNYKTK